LLAPALPQESWRSDEAIAQAFHVDYVDP
jgi:hypothetical protein